MNIALGGAHRTGKSTLARKFAEETGCLYLPSRAGEVFAEMKLPVGVKLTSDQRLTVQEKILQKHLEDVQGAMGKPWVSDRSALDFAAYTMLDAAHDPSFDHARVANYVSRCLSAANRHYNILVLVQPGIPYAAEPFKPAPNPAQQETMNLILWGLTQDPRLDCRSAFIRRDVLDLDERVTSLAQVVQIIFSMETKSMSQTARH